MNENEPASRKTGRHVVILAHPGPNSFNHSIANTYCEAVRFAGQDAVLRDLYGIGFNPVLQALEKPGAGHPHPFRDVADELEIIRRSDVFVLVYPIWFGGPPAMLKGYVDRVLGAGVVPEAVLESAPTSLLGARKLLSFSTSGLSDIWLDEQGQQSALQTTFDRYLAHAFGMCTPRHLHFGHVTDEMTERFGEQHLQDVKNEAARACTELANSREPAWATENSH